MPGWRRFQHLWSSTGLSSRLIRSSINVWYDRTWGNPNWVLSSGGKSWYKVRECPRINKLIMYFLTAGWEYRLILLLLDLGVHFNNMGIDNRVIDILRRGTDFLEVPRFFYSKFNELDKKRSYQPDHSFNFGIPNIWRLPGATQTGSSTGLLAGTMCVSAHESGLGLFFWLLVGNTELSFSCSICTSSSPNKALITVSLVSFGKGWPFYLYRAFIINGGMMWLFVNINQITLLLLSISVCSSERPRYPRWASCGFRRKKRRM